MDRDTVHAEIVPKEDYVEDLLDDLNNLDVKDTVEAEYSMEEVKEHWETDSCWVVIHDVVYDVTQFINKVV